MTESVSEILVERAREAEGLSRTVTLSFAAHAGLIAILAVVSTNWRPAQTSEKGPAMVISLGGPGGPRTSGMTPIGGRTIQMAVPMPETRQPISAAPPAAKPPEMVEAKTAPRPAPKTPPKSAPEAARGRKPTTGAEEQKGSTRAETGAKGQGFGLSSGGGGGSGSYVEGNFCCPEWLGLMEQRIRQNWDEKQQAPGETQMKFTVRRNGTIVDIETERSSGYPFLDFAALRALSLATLPPLPAEYKENQLIVHLVFRYQRR